VMNTSNWVRRSEIAVIYSLLEHFAMVVFVLLFLLCYEYSSIYKLDKKDRTNTAGHARRELTKSYLKLDKLF